jgi:hypothetical protein
MKKSVFLIISCLLFAVNMIQVSGQNPGQDDPEEIIISQSSTIPSGSPRMPAYNPFFAEFANGNVLLGSYTYYGIVDVSLTSTAGDDYSTVFDTADRTIIIPVSGYAGDYTLLITTASGLEYVGEFSI